jgi:hypothetical protein
MLHFLFGVVIVGAIIMMMVASPAFRGFVIVCILAAGLALWAMIETSNKRSEEYQAQQAVEARQQGEREQRALSLVKQTDLILEDVKLTKASYGQWDFLLAGVVTNNSAFRLLSVDFEVTISDCRDNKCAVVGQNTVGADADVPAGQKRSFSSSTISFSKSTARRD